MKCIILATFFAFAGAGLVSTPVDKVVKLLEDLKKTTEADGANELKVYDKYACWCEDTLAMKASDISQAKESIETLQMLITKLGGELSSLDVDTKQLKKDVAQNKESQKEATSVRNREFNSYDEERTESEQCVGALEAAIKVLTGAGQAKKGGKFLETLQEAQLLSTLGSLRGVLGTSTVRQEVPEKELDMVRDFINNPDDFLRAKNSMSALQMGNPFGDFAPKSGQIQGILKGMYDDFTGKLEKSNVDESKKQKGFEALMDTKKKEEKALEATLQRSEKDSAEKTKGLADSKSSLDDTKKQLEADETFFSQSKQSCKDKAQAWAERTRLRAEELQGMMTAISILSSDEAKKTFENATTTFLQLSAAESGTAYKEVRAIAEKFGGPALAQVAAEVKSGGHFDKVIHMIENMILKLKEEGQDDIKHRDLCETKQDKNKKTMEDLDFDIDKLKAKLDRMGDKEKELQSKIDKTEEEIEKSETTIKEMKDQRSKEFADFSQATKDDLEAIQLIQSAIVSLSKFYQDNNIKMTNLMQGEPEKAPDTWEDDSYGGKKIGINKYHFDFDHDQR
jgi:predicted  nucleic acid-binding Zn-ribbon protein